MPEFPSYAKQNDKPGYVVCNHLSNGTVASPLKRPTWKHDGQPYTFSIRSCFGWGLHGFLCYQRNGSLLHCLSTLTRKNLAVSLCCTIPGVASAGRYPASCPAKPGLSSPGPFRSCQPRLHILLCQKRNIRQL